VPSGLVFPEAWFVVCENQNFGIFLRVDSITQAALGAAVGEWLLGKRLGNRALAWGAAFGTLPDLDVLLSPLLNAASDLWWHRGPSHSLLVMIAASYWLSPLLAKRWKRDKVTRTRAAWFIFAVWSSHVLIDCFTVYGTSVLWPFSSYRVGFNHLFIIDFFFTLPMLVTLVWLAFLRTKKQLPKRRRLNAWGLGLASAYALLSVGMKFVASAGFEADLARRGVKFERRMEAPTPFNIVVWRSVVDRGDEFWVGYRTVFERHDTPVRWTIYPQGAAALDALGDSREAKMVRWFSDGWWIARPHAKGAWVGDLRFGEGRRWGDKKSMVDSRLVFAWDILPGAENGEHLRGLSSGRDNPEEVLKRLARRAVGDREAWEANPRLAGVTGSLPEFLAVEE
jgi:inner membrane protein